ncbi:MAG: hypothetical protein RL701_4589 [Pseudomonadota bacterium]|jgi:hypothetical protein
MAGSRMSRCELAPCLLSLALAACSQQGAAVGNLVGTYDVRGVLVGNSCGQSGLPTVNPLTFALELREDDGVGYWVSSKDSQNTGSLKSDGTFRFSVTQTQLLSRSNATVNLQPGDFQQSPDSNFDLKQTACAITISETIAGSVQRWTNLPGATLTNSVSGGASSDDLTAEDTIKVEPTTGSVCTTSLAVNGGTWIALPCEAHYAFHGSLTSEANERGSAGDVWE